MKVGRWLGGALSAVIAVLLGVGLGLAASRLTDTNGNEVGTSSARAGDGGSTDSLGGRSGCAAQPELGFVVAEGGDGIVVSDGASVRTLAARDLDQTQEGPIAVPISDEAAAVVTPEGIYIVDAGGERSEAPCGRCMGVATTGNEILTAHINGPEDDTFSIEVFDHDLARIETITARRLSEEAVQGTGSVRRHDPWVLAASADVITVAYLSANNNDDGGPTIIAQYSRSGELLEHLEIDAMIRHTSVSPDGSMVGVGVMRGGGACTIESDPLLVRLDGLELVNLDPAVPPELGEDLRFLATDVVWDEQTLLVTGEVSRDMWAHGESGDCDESPGWWTVRYDLESGDTSYLPTGPIAAQRVLGPKCDVTVDITFEITDESMTSTLTGRSNGAANELGSYSRLQLGSAPSAGCPEPPEGRPGSWPGNAASEIYFVSQLYTGELSLPGMGEEDAIAVAMPLERPEMIKIASGESWNIDAWEGWGSAEAVGTGRYGSHQDFSVEGRVVLSQPRMCGSSLMYSQIEHRWDTPLPGRGGQTSEITRIQGCE